MKILKKFAAFVLCINFLISMELMAQEIILTPDVYVETSPAATFVFRNGSRLVNNSTNGVLNGTFIFSGSDTMAIAGDQSTEFQTLNIEDGAFVDLFTDIKVSSYLNLNQGIINLLDNNLDMLQGSFINGTYSENSMIVADKAGSMVYWINQNGEYFFPVGDTTGINDYSPATLLFNSGTYNQAYVSVNLKNQKHPNNQSVANYLKRYWSVNQEGISDFDCDVVFNYVNDDIVGSESVMYGGKWNGSLWTLLNKNSLYTVSGNVGSFSDFTAGEASVLAVEVPIEDCVEIDVLDKTIYIRTFNNVKLSGAELYNQLGQKISAIDIGKSSENTIHLNSETGIYFLKISSANESFTKKIVIY
jgi:hypothetical protein